MFHRKKESHTGWEQHNLDFFFDELFVTHPLGGTKVFCSKENCTTEEVEDYGSGQTSGEIALHRFCFFNVDIFFTFQEETGKKKNTFKKIVSC